jgi:hypothetical protein
LHGAPGGVFAKPPVAFETHAHRGELTAGLWLPARVAPGVAVEVAAQAWPGATVEVTAAPVPTGVPARGTDRAWGYRLAASGTQTGWLVRTDLLTPPGTRRSTGARGLPFEPLRGVLTGLASADAPAVLQVLVRPTPRRRLAALRYAARHGGARRANPVIRVLRAGLDLVQPTPAGTPAAAGERRADPVAAKAAREAVEKAVARPGLLAAIRVGAFSPHRGAAATAARQVADGYVLTSRALLPVRLRPAARLFAERRARRAEWLLVSAPELGVLAHLPLDPAHYGFTTAALHRRHPRGAHTAAPEPDAATSSGWTPTGWTLPPPYLPPPPETQSPGDTLPHTMTGQEGAGQNQAGWLHLPPFEPSTEDAEPDNGGRHNGTGPRRGRKRNRRIQLNFRYDTDPDEPNPEGPWWGQT